MEPITDNISSTNSGKSKNTSPPLDVHALSLNDPSDTVSNNRISSNSTISSNGDVITTTNNNDVIITSLTNSHSINYDSNDEDDDVLAPIPMKVLPFKVPPKKTTFYLDTVDDLTDSFVQRNPLKPQQPPPPPPPPLPKQHQQLLLQQQVGATIVSGISHSNSSNSISSGTGNLILKTNRPKSTKRADIDSIPRIISKDDDIENSPVAANNHPSSFIPPPSIPSTTTSISSTMIDRTARSNLFNAIKLGNVELRSSAFETNDVSTLLLVAIFLQSLLLFTTIIFSAPIITFSISIYYLI